MSAALRCHMLALFVGQSQCNPLLRSKCDLDRLFALYVFKKTVGTVGMGEQCPLTRAITGFVCTHNPINVLGTGGNNFNIRPSVPIVPTLYPLKISMCGNSFPHATQGLLVHWVALFPLYPPLYLFLTRTHAQGGGKRAEPGSPQHPSGWRHSSSCPPALSANTRSVSR